MSARVYQGKTEHIQTNIPPDVSVWMTDGEQAHCSWLRLASAQTENRAKSETILQNLNPSWQMYPSYKEPIESIWKGKVTGRTVFLSHSCRQIRLF